MYGYTYTQHYYEHSLLTSQNTHDILVLGGCSEEIDACIVLIAR